MLSQKRYIIFAAVFLTFILLTGAVLAHGPGGNRILRSAEDEIEAGNVQEVDEEYQREIWRLRKRLATLNEIYRERLAEGAAENELREVENNMLDLREELTELQTEIRTENGFWGRMHHRWGLWGCDYRDDITERSETHRNHRHGMRRPHW